MRIKNEKLYIDEPIDYSDYVELLEKVEKVSQIVVNTNDIHPSIMQILLSMKNQKEITVNDEFNKRFFENLNIEE